MDGLDFDLETAIEQENIRVHRGKAGFLLMCYYRTLGEVFVISPKRSAPVGLRARNPFKTQRHHQPTGKADERCHDDYP